MKHVFLLLTFLLCGVSLACLLAGCDSSDIEVGNGDFHAPACGGYSIWRTSSNEISIVPDDIVTSATPIIPAKVVECGFDDRFIIAKRQGVVSEPKDLDYWILDTSIPQSYGPLTRDEFNQKRKELGVPASLRMKDVYKYRPSK